jgi:hypothetical protein
MTELANLDGEVERVRDRPLYEQRWVVVTGLAPAVLSIIAIAVDVISVLVLAGRFVFRVARAVADIREQRDKLLRVAADANRRADMQVLSPLIVAALQRGWIVRRKDNKDCDVHFISPDNKDVKVHFWLGPVDVWSVARELHKASPDHFPKDYVPESLSVSLVERMEMIERRLDELEGLSRNESLVTPVGFSARRV